MSKGNIVLVLFLSVAVSYLLWILYATYLKKPTEHFTLDDYEARMTVMKIFDTVLHRKPLPDEIDKYSKINNEQDMLVAVLADYNVATPPPSVAVANTDDSTDTVSATTDASPALTPAPTPSPSSAPSVSFEIPTKSETFTPSVTPAPVPSNDPTKSSAAPSKTAKQQQAASIDLKKVESSLSSIMDSVNAIRASLYTQVLCEAAA